jgi:hypothetical protein
LSPGLFLDSSVMIAGAASAEGASRAVFRLAEAHVWRLVTTPYAITETVRNLVEFPPQATAVWLQLRSQLFVVDDALTMENTGVFCGKKRHSFVRATQNPTHTKVCRKSQEAARWWR